MNPSAHLEQRLSKGRARAVRAVRACLVSFLVLVGACSEKDPLESNKSDPRWIVQKPERSKVAVVFVHGIFGDTVGTWTNPNKKTFFKLLEEAPEVGRQVDIFAFGFTSNMISPGSFDIQGAANRLHQTLKYHGILDYQAIVYAAHSMGGLVVIQHLLTRREHVEKVPLLVLYATPQEGSQMAALGKLALNNPALAEMLHPDKAANLRQLNDQWRALQPRPYVICGHEMLPYRGVTIVGWSSATRFCDEPSLGIANSDHISIAKPDRPTHESVLLLVNALKERVLGKHLTAKLEMPDFVQEGDKLVFTLPSTSWRHSARLVNAGGSKLSYTIALASGDQLHIWPDTPSEIRPHSTVHLGIALTRGQLKKLYRLFLTSDVTPKQEIVVRLPDVSAAQRHQGGFVNEVSQEVNRFLSDPVRRRALAERPANDRTVPREFVQAARAAVARLGPDLPESATWVLTAEYFAALNWPHLAVEALRAAEIASPATVQASSVQYLAGVVAASSGERGVFKQQAAIEIPAYSDVVSHTGQRFMNYAIAIENSSLLVANLQAVPSLKSYGLSLQGDIQRAKGNSSAALASYKASAALQSSPSIAGRASAVEAYAHSAPGDVGVRPKLEFKLDDQPTQRPGARLNDAVKESR